MDQSTVYTCNICERKIEDSPDKGLDAEQWREVFMDKVYEKANRSDELIPGHPTGWKLLRKDYRSWAFLVPSKWEESGIDPKEEIRIRIGTAVTTRYDSEAPHDTDERPVDLCLECLIKKINS